MFSEEQNRVLDDHTTVCACDDVSAMHMYQNQTETDFIQHEQSIGDDWEIEDRGRMGFYRNKFSLGKGVTKEPVKSNPICSVGDIDEFIACNLMPPPPVTHEASELSQSNTGGESMYELLPPPVAFDFGYETESDAVEASSSIATSPLEISSTESSNNGQLSETTRSFESEDRELLEVEVPPPLEFSSNLVECIGGPSFSSHASNEESPQFQRKEVLEHFERLAATTCVNRDIFPSRMHANGGHVKNNADFKRSLLCYSIQRPSLPPPSPPCTNISRSLLESVRTTSVRTSNSSDDRLSCKSLPSTPVLSRLATTRMLYENGSGQQDNVVQSGGQCTQPGGHVTIKQLKTTLLPTNASTSFIGNSRTIDALDSKNSPKAPSPPRRIGSIKISTSGSFSNNLNKSYNGDVDGSGICPIVVARLSSTLGRATGKKLFEPNNLTKSNLPVVRTNSTTAGKPTAQIRPNAIRSLSISSASGLNKYSQSTECLPQGLNQAVTNDTPPDDMPSNNFDFGTIRVGGRRGQAVNKTLSISKFGSLRSKIKDYVSSSSSSQSTANGGKKTQSQPAQHKPSQVLLAPETFSGYGTMQHNSKDKNGKNKTLKSVTRCWEPKTSDYHKEDRFGLVLTSPVLTSPVETSPSVTSPVVTSPVADPFSSYLNVAVPRPYSAELRHYGTLPSLRKSPLNCGTAIQENTRRQGTFRTFLGAREASLLNVNKSAEPERRKQTDDVDSLPRDKSVEVHYEPVPVPSNTRSFTLERTPSLMSFPNLSTRKIAKLKPTRSISSSSDLTAPQKINAGAPRCSYTRVQTTAMSTFRTSGSIRFQAPKQQPFLPSSSTQAAENRIHRTHAGASASLSREVDEWGKEIVKISAKVIPLMPVSYSSLEQRRHSERWSDTSSVASNSSHNAGDSSRYAPQISSTRQCSNIEKDAKTYVNTAKRTSISNIEPPGSTTYLTTTTTSMPNQLVIDSSQSSIDENDAKSDCAAEATFESVDRQVMTFMQSLQNAFNVSDLETTKPQVLNLESSTTTSGTNRWAVGPSDWSPHQSLTGTGGVTGKKNELATLTRRFVSDSQCVVSSATQSRELLVRSVASSVLNLSMIVDECRRTTARMGATPHAVILVNRVRDLVGAYGATVRASRGAIGNSFGSVEMKLLMKHATSLAAILSSLIKLLVRYEFC